MQTKSLLCLYTQQIFFENYNISLGVWSAVGGSDNTEDSPGQNHHSLAGSIFYCKKILIIINLYTSSFSRVKYLATGFSGEKESGGRGRKVVYGELDGPVEWIVTTSPSQKLL